MLITKIILTIVLTAVYVLIALFLEVFTDRIIEKYRAVLGDDIAELSFVQAVVVYLWPLGIPMVFLGYVLWKAVGKARKCFSLLLAKVAQLGDKAADRVTPKTSNS